MANFEQKEFNKFIIDNDVIGFFGEPVTLASGKTSYWYANYRNLTEDVYLTDRLADYVIAFAKDKGLHPDCFYGVPEGATKLAVLTQYKWAKASDKLSKGSHCLPMGRGKPKGHGNPKDKYFLGMPKGETVVIEDVTTTGGSLLKALDKLAETEIPLKAALGLTNRMEVRDDGLTVQQTVESKGLEWHHLSNSLDLLPLAIEKYSPNQELVDALEEEIRKYCRVEVSFTVNR